MEYGLLKMKGTVFQSQIQQHLPLNLYKG
ncbi:MAG: hypothetical protein JWP78_3934, partial [Mucilaginibacter sp.]|nr:hypothetical protein [Mucilaginibacter sp.]